MYLANCRRAFWVVCLVLLAPFQLVSAQGVVTGNQAIIEEIVTIGTRGQPRSAVDSTAPVDVISGDDFVNQGGVDTSDLLRNVVPSFNVNDQPISDAATLVRPANLRGLAPDHTLVLVNGQRRHRAAVITWLGNGLSDGSQGPDIAAIPSLALRSVEVLRDGAAAQYGSDAIAGVINFNLKNSNSGGAFEAKYGEYSAGDGAQISFAINRGFAVGETGFINLTAEWADVDPTDRAVQRDDAIALIANGYQNVTNPAQVWGTPEFADDYKLWANFGADLNDSVELFGMANYNNKDVLGGFYYRNPTNRGGVYSGDGGDTLLIGDLTPGPLGQDNSAFPLLSTGDGVDCPEVAVNGPNGPPEAIAFAQVQADPSCFSFQEIITGGFTPNFGGEITDQAFQIGLRGETDGGLGWSVSTYWASNEVDYVINNTVNASLGPNTPRDFDPGSYQQEDFNINAGFTYRLGDRTNLGFGAEYRTEEFSIGAGQMESYIDGGLGTQGFSTSSNGFPGFSPRISGSWERKNYAVYVDLERYVIDNLLLGAAVRFEDFDDFGTTTNFKLGANWSVIDNLGFRATLSTGFKAPTPGQSNASNITTQLVNRVLTNQGVIPSVSPVAMLRGGNVLDPEESTNFTLGSYFNVGPVDFTIDYFHIDVEDRLSLSNDFTLLPSDVMQLANQGIDASDVAQFRFFTNQFDTNTSGIDVVATTDTEWLGGTTTWNLAYNYTDTDVTDRDPMLLNDDRVRLIEDGTPNTRWNLTANHNVGDWRFLARLNYYDEHYDNEAVGVFSDAFVIDLEASLRLNENIDLTLGGRNVNDETGCSTGRCGDTPPGILGLPSSQFTPFGFNGAFYYGRLTFNFD